MTDKVKHIITFLATAMLFTMGLTSCGSSDYEELLDDENNLIKAYIKRHDIKVVSRYPADSVWGDNVYYKTGSGLYIHIDEYGDKNDSVKANQMIIAAYKKVSLEIDEEVVTDNTKDGDKIIYGSSSDASTGMLEAIGIMKYHGTKAKIIMPSRIANSIDMNAVIPYLYEMSIKIADN